MNGLEPFTQIHKVVLLTMALRNLFFSLKRGVRQGCPLSGILFVIGVEFLLCNISSDKSIKGLSLNSKEFKSSQYVMTLLALLKILHRPTICLKNCRIFSTVFEA